MKTVKILLLIGIGVSFLLVAGCKCPAKPVAAAPAAMEMKPCGVSETRLLSQPYPVADERYSVIRVEKMSPDWVAVNSPFDYNIKVTNISESDLDNVVVTDSIPKNLKVNNSTPEMKFIPGDHGQWKLGTLKAGESKTITINATAFQPGTIGSCATVDYDRTICSQIEVVEPKLTVSVSAPSEVSVCEEIPVEYTVTNSGNMDICGLSVTSSMQDGLMTTEGLREARFDTDALMPGKSQTYKQTVKAERSGTYNFTANATAQGGIQSQSSAVTTSVYQPMLEISQKAPDMRYIDRPVPYELTVTNKGDGSARDTVVELQQPAGARFISATEGGQHSEGRIIWNLGTLEPGASRSLSADFSSDRAGLITTEASARAVCAETVRATTETNIQGIPGILLEVIDTSDPIEVGQNETYMITVTNQGSAMDTNVTIECTLDENMMYVSSSGPTQATASERTIRFAPLSSIGPKEKVTWQVLVKALNKADSRFRTELKSDQLTGSVGETESTRFYE